MDVRPTVGAHIASASEPLGQLLQTAVAGRRHGGVGGGDRAPARVLARQRDGAQPLVGDDAAARGIQALFAEFPPPAPKGKEPQQANYCVGLTTTGDIYVSKVGGMARETQYLRTIRAQIESNRYQVGRTIRLAGTYNTACTSGNHAEMCILAAAHADELTLSVIYCSGPHCAYCAALMKKAGITRGATEGDHRQSGWAHPLAPIFLGSSVDEDTSAQLEALKQLKLDPSATDVQATRIVWLPTRPKQKKGTLWL